MGSTGLNCQAQAAYTQPMSDPRAQLQLLRSLIESAPALPERGGWLALVDAAMPASAASGGSPEMTRLRQDVEDAEHARDAANLQRMKVAGQLNTLHKSLSAAVPEVAAGSDAQSDALRRIEHLVSHGASAPGALEAARAAGFEGPLGARASEVFAQAHRAGLAELDDAAIFKYLRDR